MDIFSYANEFPYRIEFDDEKIESIRTFNINSQLSIESKSKILIIPNTNSKESTTKRTSLIKYLDQKSVVWIKDLNYSSGKISDFFEKSIEEFHTNNTNLSLNINLSKIKILKIFKWLKRKNISDQEMLRTFNCGVGLHFTLNC